MVSATDRVDHDQQPALVRVANEQLALLVFTVSRVVERDLPEIVEATHCLGEADPVLAHVAPRFGVVPLELH